MCGIKDRDLKKSVIYVNSRNRITGKVNNFKYSITPGIRNALYYSISHITIPRTEYNIESTHNKFVFSDSGGTDRTITISEGNYTAAAFATALENAMTSAGADNYTVTANTTTAKYEIKSDSSPFILKFGTDSITKRLGLKMGYTDDTYSGAGAGSPYISNNIFNMSPSENYYIVSNTIHGQDIAQFINGSLYNVIASIPLNGAFGDLLIREPSDYVKIPISDGQNGQKITQLDFSLIDERGELVELNGIDWSMEIIIYYVDLN